MRWWLNTDAPKVFSVDNAAVTGMDFSSLTPDVWMVQWTEGKGEIERQDASGNNLNGLREPFIDVAPYAPLFQQFLTRMKAKALLLPQAKKIDVDLIGLIFDSKRQAPFHYTVAAGDYYWDATDATLFSSLVPAIQNLTATLNSLIGKVNAAVTTINAVTSNITTQTNAQLDNVSGFVNADIAVPGNNAFTFISTQFLEVNANIVDKMNAFLKTGTTSVMIAATPPTFTNVVAAMPGLTSDIAAIDANPYNITSMAALGHIAPGSAAWTNQANVPTSNVQWIPIGASAPVNVTPAEQAAILTGITARTNDLNVKKNTKLAAVYAMTDIDDVIDYDVTTGW